MNSKNDNIFIITGNLHQGKTTFAENTVYYLQKQCIPVAGFLSHGYFSEGRRNSFTLVDIQTGKKRALCSDQPHENWYRYRRFYFNPDALQAGNQLLMKIAEQSASVAVIDEIGPMELEQKGWYAGFTSLMANAQIIKILIVRNNILDTIKELYDIDSQYIYTVDQSSPYSLAQVIVRQYRHFY